MVSTIIPCYNAAPWLRSAIESALAQSRPVDEILVVDDCSTDASRAIAAEYPVRVLQTSSNGGHARARNLALREAVHDTVAWLDADDYWEPNHCAVVLPLLERNPTAAVAFSAVRQFGERNSVWAMPNAGDVPVSMLWESFTSTIVPASSAITTRQAALDVGGFREEIRIAPDFEFWIRMARKFPFVWTQDVTVNYRRHRRQISADEFSQLRSIYQSRLLLTQEARDAGDDALAGEMRERSRTILDQDLAEAWWQGDMPLVRELLALGRRLGFETPGMRKLAKLAWAPAALLRGWRTLQARVSKSPAPRGSSQQPQA